MSARERGQLPACPHGATVGQDGLAVNTKPAVAGTQGLFALLEKIKDPLLQDSPDEPTSPGTYQRGEPLLHNSGVAYRATHRKDPRP